MSLEKLNKTKGKKMEDMEKIMEHINNENEITNSLILQYENLHKELYNKLFLPLIKKFSTFFFSGKNQTHSIKLSAKILNYCLGFLRETKPHLSCPCCF